MDPKVLAYLLAQRLTKREAEIGALVFEGYKNRVIAEYYDIHLVTVKFHMTNLLRKMRVKSRIELKAWILKGDPVLPLGDKP